MNKRFNLLLWAFLIGALSAVQAQTPFFGEYKSPDRSVVMTVFQEDGRSFFKVQKNKAVIIDRALMGIETSQGSFYADLSLRSKVRDRTRREKYTLNNGKASKISKRYRHVVFRLENLQGKPIDIEFRLFDDGLAYRYKLYGRGECTIIKEHGNFALPLDAKGYLTPLAKPKTGFGKTNPSYEEHYVYGVPVGTPSSIGNGWSYPALFEMPGAGWMLLSETGTDGNYCATHLDEVSSGGIYKIVFPNIEEGLYSQSVYPTTVLPYETPWRMMIVADNPTKIAESTLATDLVEPVYKPEIEYALDKASWSWLVLKDDSITYEVTRKYIDMASHLDFKYCLVDAPWDVQIGRTGIEELSAYAQSRGVGLLLWYNSNGDWNEAPQTPKDRMHTPKARREEMQWMQEHGIKGIKVDFFGGDKQFYMKYYEDILRDANKYGLLVNFHGTTLPRGWERMYPNFATLEAVKGMEFVTFSQSDADMQAMHCATLPFIRNVVGPMDFTPVILNSRLGINTGVGPYRRTTAAFELALPVIFQSGVQHFGLVPENIDLYPFFLTDYFRKLPTTWDETRFLSGIIGKEVVVARRKGSMWYVAGINAESVEKTFQLDLSDFLKSDTEGKAIVSMNGGSLNDVDQITVLAPSRRRTLSIQVAAQDGFVMCFETDKKK